MTMAALLIDRLLAREQTELGATEAKLEQLVDCALEIF
ncbi:MAG: hypothetical protein OJF58_003952 [Enhydrobacter sp.]|jgi:hypothetical protein|nr:MAG: hypothetical protein OJF58_003952 [Enhydrobacter sp.]